MSTSHARSLELAIPAAGGTALAGIGLAVLAGWMTGSRVLTAMRPEYIPVAPNTAVLFLLLGGALWLALHGARGSLLAVRVASGLALLVSGLRLSEYLFGVQLAVDRWLFSVPSESLGLAPVGRMAFFTALSFVLGSGALFALTFPRRPGWIEDMTRSAALLVTVVGLVFLLGYAYGSPLLYGGKTIPMALPTAAGFLLLGLSIVVPALLRDVRRRRDVQRALRDSHEELERRVAIRTAELAASLERITDAFVALDRNFRITYVNRAAALLEGRRPEELIGLTYREAWPASAGAEPERQFRRAMEHQAPAHFVHRYESPGARDVTLEIHAYPAPEGLSIFYRDVGEQARLEEQLRQSQKMEAVGQLAGGVAHDFNNMLTAIKSYAAMLELDLGADDPRRADAVEIGRAADRAAALTRQLLAFSRRQLLQPRPLDVNASIEDMQSMLRRLIGPDIEIHARLGPDIGTVMADPNQLEQVILNLAVNARDAMPEGGTLAIETANVELDESYARLHGVSPAEARGPFVVLSVSDSGVGMDADTQARIFEPFFTTKGPGKGTGLGLSTVYGIVRQSGGYVWCYSAPGKGTTFKVYLPRIDGGAAPSEHAVATRIASRGSETILLVEDDDAVRAVSARALRKAGYTVLEAADGQAALIACAERDAPVDLVITDMLMPAMGGRELAASIRSRFPTARMLFMSGYTEDAARRQRFLEPGEAFIEKPFAPDALVRKVRETIDGAGARGPSYTPPGAGTPVA